MLLRRGPPAGLLLSPYGWLPLRTPTHCACGSSFLVDHALSCPKGGLPSIRHNKIRDLTAKLLTEVCSQGATEPELQPVSPEEFSLSTANTQDGARLNIVMNELWGGRSERAFVDVRVFNPFAPFNTTNSLSTCYKKHENIKKELTDNISERLNTACLHLWLCQRQGA